MSAYTVHTASSPLNQITRGFFTGFRWFFRLLVTVAMIVFVGVLLYKVGAKSSGESNEAVDTYHDIRRNIAVGVNGSPIAAPIVPKVEPWKALIPAIVQADKDSGFDSRVEVRRKAGDTVIRIMFGPYDPDLSQRLKSSSGWVTLKLAFANGQSVPGFESGVKIPLDRFEFHQEDGLPVGWIYRGRLAKVQAGSASDIRTFELGWVVPSGMSPQRTAQMGMRPTLYPSS